MITKNKNRFSAHKVRNILMLAGCFSLLVIANGFRSNPANSANSVKPGNAKIHVKPPLPVDPCTTPCPTDYPPTTIPFNGPFSYETYLNGDDGLNHGCYVEICYCTRETSPGNNDFVITDVIPLDGSGCDTTTIASYVDDAYQDLLLNNPMGFPCPPCGDTIQNYYHEVKGSCWHIVEPNPINGYYHPHVQQCSSYFWCMTPYRICCDTMPEYIQGATVVFGDSSIVCSGDCSSVPCVPPPLP